MDNYQNFIHQSRYARWDEINQRRETWEETVDRYLSFIISKGDFDYKDVSYILRDVRSAILNLDVMPSMRAMMTAGDALERDNVAGYNCSYLAVDDTVAFDEAMYLLMCGVGVGYSVEEKYTDKLPKLPYSLRDISHTIIVEDSKIGWCKAFRELITFLYEGVVPKVDYKKLRAAGEPLKVFGGRSSGPEPLKELFEFTIKKFRQRVYELTSTDIYQLEEKYRLTPADCHHIMCKVGDIVVVGGVRRSALISLFDNDDEEMLSCKSGEWWKESPHLRLANNSAIFGGKNKGREDFSRFWKELSESKFGEPGFFNRTACKLKTADIGRNPNHEFGCNPCSEIILRPMQFCNLTEVVARKDDTLSSLIKKVGVATFLGTIQSSFTNFRYLRPEWKKNCEEERLLGVSITGIYDCPVLSTSDELKIISNLTNLRAFSKSCNKKWAKKLGIPESAAVTCVKPSGTVSQLVNSASGIHARHNEIYVRNVLLDNKDPLCAFMKEKGFPCSESVNDKDSTCFHFAIKSPSGCKTRLELSAIDHLKLWKIYQDHWCDHKPSCTVYVKPEEWEEVGEWVEKNLDSLSGIAFLPSFDHVYKQAPFEDCTEDHFVELWESTPGNIDWTKMKENQDNTIASQELACKGGSCEI